jgi:hypothetical protein
VWDSAAFSSIFLASGFSCSQALSTPAHTQVTQTVGWQRRRASAKPYLFRKFRFNNWLKNSVPFLAVAFFK